METAIVNGPRRPTNIQKINNSRVCGLNVAVVSMLRPEVEQAERVSKNNRGALPAATDGSMQTIVK